MNLVKLIEDQLSGDVLGKLSSLLGTDEDATERAASAAVPALLSGLAGLAGSESGAKKLTAALGNFDGGIGNVAQSLGSDASSLLQKGTGIFASLLGDSLLGNFAQAIGRFTGLGGGTIKSLLGYLTPIVMSVIGSQWKSRGGTTAALTNLFAEQKQNIAAAVPAGFSLGEIPGLPAAKETVRSATESTRRAAESAGQGARSMASWALPLAVLVVGGLLLWNFLGRDRGEAPAVPGTPQQVTALKPSIPELPTAAKMTEDLTGMFRSMGETLNGITDAATAEAALPQLEEFSGKIDELGKLIAPMPETARSTLQGLVNDRLGGIKDQAAKTLSLPGISARVRTVIEQIVRKLEDWKIIDRAG